MLILLFFQSGLEVLGTRKSSPENMWNLVNSNLCNRESGALQNNI